MQRRVNWPDIKPSGYSANLEAGYCRFDKITDTYPAIFFGKGNNCLALTGTNFSFGLSRIRPFLAIVCKYLLSSYRYIFGRKSVFFKSRISVTTDPVSSRIPDTKRLDIPSILEHYRRLRNPYFLARKCRRYASKCSTQYSAHRDPPCPSKMAQYTRSGRTFFTTYLKMFCFIFFCFEKNLCFSQYCGSGSARSRNFFLDPELLFCIV